MDKERHLNLQQQSEKTNCAPHQRIRKSSPLLMTGSDLRQPEMEAEKRGSEKKKEQAELTVVAEGQCNTE